MSPTIHRSEYTDVTKPSANASVLLSAVDYAQNYSIKKSKKKAETSLRQWSYNKRIRMRTQLSRGQESPMVTQPVKGKHEYMARRNNLTAFGRLAPDNVYLNATDSVKSKHQLKF